MHFPKSLFHTLKETYLVLCEICTWDNREAFLEELVLAQRYEEVSNLELVK